MARSIDLVTALATLIAGGRPLQGDLARAKAFLEEHCVGEEVITFTGKGSTFRVQLEGLDQLRITTPGMVNIHLSGRGNTFTCSY